MPMLSILSTMAVLLGNEAAAVPPTEQRVEVRVRSSWDGLGPSVKSGGFDVVCLVSECPFGVRLLLRCLGASPNGSGVATTHVSPASEWIGFRRPGHDGI